MNEAFWFRTINCSRAEGKVNPVKGHEQKIFLFVHANGYRMRIVNMQAT